MDIGDGERGRNRTSNLLIKSQLLCQLSYAPDAENLPAGQFVIVASPRLSRTATHLKPGEMKIADPEHNSSEQHWAAVGFRYEELHAVEYSPQKLKRVSQTHPATSAA
jgi:hypothetical protein